MTCLNRIRDAIAHMEAGQAFSARDFLPLCEYDSVRQALSQLAKESEIRRVLQGIYDRPAYSNLLMEYAEPSPHDVALALARKHMWTISPGGDAALNLLGLSTQVPATWQYVSSGPYKTYRLGRQSLEFLHRNNSQMEAKSPETVMIIQALKALGADSAQAIDKLSARLASDEKQRLAQESSSAPLWMQPVIKRICGEAHA